eukprot:NODE_2251_length_444_cov_55.164557_g2171_i0.p1 GENE.NODE_2251_length_444_cov_55.164557_g2171_i0~~NODE_2251_length_444_cov_55.164557_g2171_i0.p1  ORF type:complete len:88 (-),score=13.10 NODE_2251_length_444_cov_55.164557_g2171_i0:42-305(-)
MKGLSGMIILWWPTFYLGNRVADFVKERFPVPPCAAAASPCDCEKGEGSQPGSDKVGSDKTQELHHGGDSSEMCQPSAGDVEQPSSV